MSDELDLEIVSSWNDAMMDLKEGKIKVAELKNFATSTQCEQLLRLKPQSMGRIQGLPTNNNATGRSFSPMIERKAIQAKRILRRPVEKVQQFYFGENADNACDGGWAHITSHVGVAAQSPHVDATINDVKTIQGNIAKGYGDGGSLLLGLDRGQALNIFDSTTGEYTTHHYDQGTAMFFPFDTIHGGVANTTNEEQNRLFVFYFTTKFPENSSQLWWTDAGFSSYKP